MAKCELISVKQRLQRHRGFDETLKCFSTCASQRGTHAARLPPSCGQRRTASRSNRSAVWSSGVEPRSHCSGCCTAPTSTTSAPSLDSSAQRTAERYNTEPSRRSRGLVSFRGDDDKTDVAPSHSHSEKLFATSALPQHQDVKRNRPHRCHCQSCTCIIMHI